MSEVFTLMLGYILSVVANFHTDEILKSREAALKDELKDDEALQKALASISPIRNELQEACVKLYASKDHPSLPASERAILELLGDEEFQQNLYVWFKTGGIEEGAQAKAYLIKQFETALIRAGVDREQSVISNSEFFERIDKTLFSHPVLARWRHQQSLDYLREQVSALRQQADEIVGRFTEENQQIALNSYCDKALAVWDILDLSNLPEGDIHMATQKLLLRQLYMPLRIEIEKVEKGEADDVVLARLEEQRELRRHREAGHGPVEDSYEGGRKKIPSHIGECLSDSHRLVVLGDPGGGKTTMLRWLATAYLLKGKEGGAFAQFPDTQTLPDKTWIPVLIRCRDLGEAELCRCFTDFLSQHLLKTDLLPNDANIMCAVILDKLAKGDAILLVDGLDEIANPHVRMMFCQELERTATRYPNAPIVVSSRIVGYRDMPYRMSSEFAHGQIAELTREDKDLFARRWVEVAEHYQTEDEKSRRAQDLLDALHSSDRIERLTGNPMLLTTLTLVKRKVGKLPNRRTKLYSEAVSVLLNWNPRLYQTIEEDEAIPQLEYLAYEMCRRGVQRLTNENVLDLLDKLRAEYPNIRAIRRRSPEDFLQVLEARSSIVIKSGGIWRQGHALNEAVWEFRHLTFQEFLAARAILDGRYPGRDKTLTLAEQVFPLASAVKSIENRPWRRSEDMEIPESWREALRLLVADCKDDDVDNALLAILGVSANGELIDASRPRAALAALCLADEPNVDEENAERVLKVFVQFLDANDGSGGASNSILEQSALEVGRSIWHESLKRLVVSEFDRRTSETQWNVGAFWGTVEAGNWRRSKQSPRAFFESLAARLAKGDRIEVASAALTIMECAFYGDLLLVDGIIDGLLNGVGTNDRMIRYACAWALGWINIEGGYVAKPAPLWRASGASLDRLVDHMGNLDDSEIDTLRWLSIVLGHSQSSRAVDPLIKILSHSSNSIRINAIQELARLGDKRAIGYLLPFLNDADAEVSKSAIVALGNLKAIDAVPALSGALGGSDSAKIIAIINAFAEIGDRSVLPIILKELESDAQSIRVVAINALGLLGDNQVVPILITKMGTTEAHERLSIVTALGRLKDPRAESVLAGYLNASDLNLNVEAALALARLGNSRGMETLFVYLGHSDEEWRRHAVRAMVKLRNYPNEDILMSQDFDGSFPWLDPKAPITQERIQSAAQRIGLDINDAREMYQRISVDFRMRVAEY